MTQEFKGWEEVSVRLKKYVEDQESQNNESECRLNSGQLASLIAIADRIKKNGIVIADEVGMGKTRITVELVRSVIESGGRVAILVPPGLGFQWQAELRDGKVEAPLILRSLWQYLAAWEFKNKEEQHPWFNKNVVMISHAFTNWRLGEKTDPWRWALLPELYALWRKRTLNRLPRGYNDNKKLLEKRVRYAAKSICDSIPLDEQHPAWRLAIELGERTPWPGALDGSEYGRNQNLRPWLERSVGLGLGIFDLVIIDEAHKNRGIDSGLSRLLDNVILMSTLGRRFAMTATPVELDVSQWEQTLSRIGVKENYLNPIKQAIARYSETVKRVRQCPNNPEIRNAYKQSAVAFKSALSPYILRRDKREDKMVKLFAKRSGLPINDYRREIEISIETSTLTPMWKQAVCAAEALSIVTRQADDRVAKRLRLTLGNGHGISTLLDQLDCHKDDNQQREFDEEQNIDKLNEDVATDLKRDARAQWWLSAMKQAFSSSDDSLFDHPAIMAAVQNIENSTSLGEKVLVFGRFTLPLRRLVDLLNAREMLRYLQSGRHWPQAMVHDGVDSSEWPAIRVAHRQLKCEIPLEMIDLKLAEQYKSLENQRENMRRNLIKNIEKGFESQVSINRAYSLFDAFKKSAQQCMEEDGERHPIALVSKALYELMANESETYQPTDFSEAFVELLSALSDRSEGDLDSDRELDENESNHLWPILEARLREEYNQSRGSFARLMFGGTRPESRRMLQLAFNRSRSFPNVLVAQSMVGREGLNLHKSCRTVVLLHPEWNPGVVEQQIGRVDRIGSHWATQLEIAIEKDCSVDELPRIEIRPVIFKGTYDEHNWNVLRDRWDDLRAQLHGVVISPRDQNNQELINEITNSAPNFSPGEC